jgi:hypothetical protein
VADSTSTVWVDATFITEPLEGQKDVRVEFYPADNDVIGDRSIPVIYQTAEPDILGEIDNQVEYFNETTSTSGLLSVAEEYYVFAPPKIEDVYISLVEFFAGEKDLDSEKNVSHIYTTGYNAISGTLDKRITFIAGNRIIIFNDTPVSYRAEDTASGVIDRLVNYMNFSGNTDVSGEPIPFYSLEIDVPHEYTRTTPIKNIGGVNQIVEIAFAGWISTYIGTDIYSVDQGFNEGYNYEVMISGGGVDVHYLEAYSTTLTVSGVDFDVYCSLVDMAAIGAEAETSPGKIANYYYEVYSCAETHGALNLDIDLFSIKITNFSLDVGEYTTASGFVSVDVLDDECPITTSGTYFMVDGVRVPVTFLSIQDGYRMYYDPEDDFSSLEGPTTFTVHVENDCGKTLEQDYYLTFGYVVEYDNHPSSWQGMDYGFNNKIAVRVTAENYASCPQVSSLAWDFESKEYFNQDLGASIVGTLYNFEAGDLSAEIAPQSTAYFYGKHFEVVVNARDFAGNEMKPLILTYRIEDKPEN